MYKPVTECICGAKSAAEALPISCAQFDVDPAGSEASIWDESLVRKQHKREKGVPDNYQ